MKRVSGEFGQRRLQNQVIHINASPLALGVRETGCDLVETVIYRLLIER